MAELVKEGPWNGRSRRVTTRITVALAISALAALGVYLAVGGGSEASASSTAEEPAVVEEVKGSDLLRITLSEKAMRRLDVQTAAVRGVTVNGKQRTAVPYAAVLYDPEGLTWVYRSPKTRTFIRARITVASIDGTRAILSAGPVAGTKVVTVGGQELFGTEIDY
jgi:uncharacterized protein YcfL